MRWIGNDEFAQQHGDHQIAADPGDASADMAGVNRAVQDMNAAPLGEPESDYDVRSVYDSRPVNAFDFNLAGTATDGSGVGWSITFQVPNGYRAVPKKWEVVFDNPPPGPVASSTVTILSNGAALPYNSGIIIGTGGTVDTFFLCEENSTFGIKGHNSNIFAGNVPVSVNVWGQLIPVSDVALPFTASNRKR